MYKTVIYLLFCTGAILPLSDSGGFGEYVYPRWRKQKDAAENDNEKLHNSQTCSLLSVSIISMIKLTRISLGSM